jgi:hypothetical protein
MELNHQIRLCRPFPFLFGFRAIFYVNRGANHLLWLSSSLYRM